MSAALIILAILALARFVLIAVVASVALATTDQRRRTVAVDVLRILRPTLAAVAGAEGRRGKSKRRR